MLTQRLFAAQKGRVLPVLVFLVSIWLAAVPAAARAQATPEGRGSDPAWQASFLTLPDNRRTAALAAAG